MIGFKHARAVNSFLDLNGPTLETKQAIKILTDEVTLTVSPALPSGVTSINLLNYSDPSNTLADLSFAPGTTYTLTSDGNFNLTMTLEGGNGGDSKEASRFITGGPKGGKGGRVTGTVLFEKGQTYTLVVGQAGVMGGDGSLLGGGGATTGLYSGSGGGYTGLFRGTVSQENALLIAGGGGGASYGDYEDPFNPFGADTDEGSRAAIGGLGGGLKGGFINPTLRGISRILSGRGGTQTEGGAKGSYSSSDYPLYDGFAGTALQGGAGSTYQFGNREGGGGGGGGYFGGGGGAYSFLAAGSGGGGSGFIAVEHLDNAFFSGSSSASDGSVVFETTSFKRRKLVITGVSTATFSDTQTIRNTNSGSISYKWYQDGVSLSDTTRITGTASSEITITDPNFADDVNKKYFLRAEYENSAYASGLTPNALNEPFDIPEFTIESSEIPPAILITSQPNDVVNEINNDVTFTVAATSESNNSTFKGPGLFNFDWRYNGYSLSDMDTLKQAFPQAALNFSTTGTMTDIIDAPGVPSYTNTLTIKNSNIELSKIQCVITSAGTAPNSVSTRQANYDCTGLQSIVFYERYKLGGDTTEQLSNKQTRTANNDLRSNPACASDSNSGLLSGWYTRTGSPQSDPFAGVRNLVVKWDGNNIDTTGATYETIDGIYGLLVGNIFYVPEAYVGESPYGWCSSDACGTCSSPFGDHANGFNMSRYNYVSKTEPGVIESYENNLKAAGALTLRASSDSNSRTICLFAPNNDVPVKITLGGAAAAPARTREGGEGGLSVFTIIMKRNEEYIVKLGVNEKQDGGPTGGLNGGGGVTALYHKAKLIACCGGGGGAGPSGDGGAGGGLGIPGEDGFGANAGRGGALIPNDLLPITGFSDVDEGGRIDGCTTGNYYKDLGLAPCEDVTSDYGSGLAPFLTSDGSLTKGSSYINRGYKEGQGNRNNAGSFFGNEGGGGAGATGGTAATNNGSGGGGGSGYYDGSEVTLLSGSTLPLGTRLGGNDGVGFISIETADTTSENYNVEPTLPPPIIRDAVNNVTFAVSREAGDTNTITFRKTAGGTGPEYLTFGPNAATITVALDNDCVYERTGVSASGGRGATLRLSGGTLQLDDNLDYDFNDLQVTPYGGTFTSTNVFVAGT